MSLGRGHFVCGAVFGVAIGFAAGHLVSVGRSSAPLSETPRLTLSVDEPDLAADPPRLAVLPVGSEPKFDRYPAHDVDAPPIAPRVVTADAFRKTPLELVPPTVEPKPLPETEAAPLKPSERQPGAALGRIVESELHSVAPQQKEVWRDTLDGVSPESAAEILRLWKDMGTTSLPGPAPSPHVEPETDQDVPVLGASPRSASLAAMAPAVLARLQRNLAHQQTPGFRQSLPVLTDAETPAGPRVRVAGLAPDVRPGDMIETGNPWTVAIGGTGFFHIQVDGEFALTRCGRLACDGERRLGMRIGEVVRPLEPEVRIPENAVGLVIESEGKIVVDLAGETEPKTIGRIDVVTVLNVGELQEHSIGNSTFITTPASGPMHVLGVGGPLRQGYLEASNVDVPVTQAWIERLQRAAEQGLLVP